MNPIESQIKQAQRRLWVNRWLRQWGWSLLTVTIIWIIAWLADRLFALRLPMAWSALGGLAASLIISAIWLIPTREPILAAAVVLDEAANLRERLSSGLFARQNTADPFAQAVVADAEKAAAGLSAKAFVPIRWAPSLSLSALLLVLAVLSLLLPEFDLLGAKQAKANESVKSAQRLQAREALVKPVSAIQEIAQKNPELDVGRELQDKLDALDRDKIPDPDALRRETVKKLDQLQQALKNKTDSDRYQALDETKKRLKQVGQPSDPKNELSKLMENISAGDFDQAQKEIKQLQEKLAKRSAEGGGDAKQVEEMRKQLDEIAEKLQKAGEDNQSKQELKNAGLSQAEAQRILDALAKKDPKQVEKLAKDLAQRLKDKGMTEEQAKSMLNKIKQRQQGCSQCKQMGSKMADAAKQLERGNTEAASSELGEAGEMLNEMEQVEEGLKDIQSQMAKLDEARSDMNNKQNPGQCRQCDGTGFRKDGSPCPSCNGGDGQQGRGGQGRGAGPRDRNDNVSTATVDKKDKVKTTKDGRVIGQQFVKGQQLKGQSGVELQDAAAAAEIDATNALDKDRVPRAYRKAVRNYFDRLGAQIPGAPGDAKKTDKDGADAKPAEDNSKDAKESKDSGESDTSENSKEPGTEKP